jgi:hypothetical protein
MIKLTYDPDVFKTDQDIKLRTDVNMDTLIWIKLVW